MIDNPLLELSDPGVFLYYFPLLCLARGVGPAFCGTVRDSGFAGQGRPGAGAWSQDCKAGENQAEQGGKQKDAPGLFGIRDEYRAGDLHGVITFAQKIDIIFIFLLNVAPPDYFPEGIFFIRFKARLSRPVGI